MATVTEVNNSGDAESAESFMAEVIDEENSKKKNGKGMGWRLEIGWIDVGSDAVPRD